MQYKVSMYNVYIEKNGTTFIYNTMTGALSKINNEVFNNLSNNNIDKSKYLSILLKQGYIVPKSINEANVFLTLNKSFVWETPDILHYTIAPSLSCQLNCVYCFEKRYIQQLDRHNNMDISLAQKTVNFILSQIKSKKKSEHYV